jgi:hypothetical protein
VKERVGSQVAAAVKEVVPVKELESRVLLVDNIVLFKFHGKDTGHSKDGGFLGTGRPQGLSLDKVAERAKGNVAGSSMPYAVCNGYWC